MRKKMFYLPMLFLTVGILLSCGNKDAAGAGAGSDAKAKLFAENLCKFAKEIGFDTDLKLDEEYMRKHGDKFEDNFYENSDKFLTLLKDLDTHLKTLNEEQKQAFTKELLKAMIDTDCSNILLKSIPYGMLSDGIKEIEKEITSAKYRKDHPVDEYSYAEPSMEEYADAAVEAAPAY
jgi:hypothetical protein